MTRSVDVDFTFKRPIDVLVALHLMMESGMNPSIDGEISYLLDEDGAFDWVKAAPGSLEDVITKLGASRWKDGTVGITLLFPDSVHGGDFLFHPGRTMVSYVVSVNLKYLPGSSRFCDMGWYLDRLIPILEPLGLEGIEARDSLY